MTAATVATLFVTVVQARAQSLLTLPIGYAQCGFKEFNFYELGAMACNLSTPTVQTSVAQIGDASTHATAVVGRQSTTDPPGSAHGRAVLTYQVRIAQEATPEHQPGQVPITIKYKLSASTSGVGGGGQANIVVGYVNGGVLFTDSKSQPQIPGGSGEATTTSTWHGSVSVNAGVGVVLTANAIARIDADWEDLSSYGSATADPQITFDQEAFDAELGEDSFPLEDYYSLELSPGMTNHPVPFADGFESGSTAAWSATVG